MVNILIFCVYFQGYICKKKMVKWEDIFNNDYEHSGQYYTHNKHDTYNTLNQTQKNTYQYMDARKKTHKHTKKYYVNIN